MGLESTKGEDCQVSFPECLVFNLLLTLTVMVAIVLTPVHPQAWCEE